ncbi:kisspeptin 2 [Oncorhynchus nerka]|uniref:kisspeptin 2 n=1 Tax=Oncorhynchus nerka TaxID=8023 RepID=UPI0031B843E3
MTTHCFLLHWLDAKCDHLDFDRMRMLAFFLVCAIIRQYGTWGTPTPGFGWTDIPGHTPAKAQEGHSVVMRSKVVSPNLPDDANLCYLLKEGDEDQQQIICKHRLTRTSKFNFNPFGLRFGKRDKFNPSKASLIRSSTSKLLPILLYFRELEIPA